MIVTTVVLTNAAQAKCFHSQCRSRMYAVTHQILNLSCVLSQMAINGTCEATQQDLRTATQFRHGAWRVLTLYVLYVLYLTRQATEHPLSPGFLAICAICAISHKASH